MKNHAILYAQKFGWAVFPVHGIHPDKLTCTCNQLDCGSPGKHPVQMGGFKQATKDQRLINMLFKDHYNIGVVTGETSGIWVLDIDGAEGEASLTALQKAYGNLPATLIHRTGKGRHLIFRMPSDDIRNSTSKIAPSIDVRGNGGYIVAAPSRHSSGVSYRFDDIDQPIADAPQWLLDMVVRKKEKPQSTILYTAPDTSSEADIISALDSLDPDMPYDDWVKVGMALHSGGHKLAIWDQWSAKGEKYHNGDCRKRWGGFKPNGDVSMGTFWDMAYLAGWERPSPDGPHPAQSFIDKIRAEYYSADEDLAEDTLSDTLPDFPISPLEIPGLVGDTVRDCCSSAIKPQPVMCLLNTIAALGAVFGRRYASPWKTRTNIYTVGLAGTGEGKDHSRKYLKTLMVKAGLSEFIGSDAVVSGPGLLKSISNSPAQIMMLDEMGMVLEAVADRNGPSYMRAVSKILTEMYSSANSIYTGGQYASDAQEQIIIESPNLCVYGTSTVEKYAEAISRSSIASGEWNRYIVAPGGSPKQSRNVNTNDQPPALVAAWAALTKDSAEPKGNLQGLIPTSAPEPITVKWDSVEDRIYDLGDLEDDLKEKHKIDGTGALWMRMRENTIKVAMIMAISRNPTFPEITEDDLTFAEQLVQWSVRYMIYLSRQHMADSQAEQDCNFIMTIVRRAGAKGITKTELSRATKSMGKRRRDEALVDLEINQERLTTAEVPKKNGRPVKRYVANE